MEFPRLVSGAQPPPDFPMTQCSGLGTGLLCAAALYYTLLLRGWGYSYGFVVGFYNCWVWKVSSKVFHGWVYHVESWWCGVRFIVISWMCGVWWTGVQWPSESMVGGWTVIRDTCHSQGPWPSAAAWCRLPVRLITVSNQVFQPQFYFANFSILLVSATSQP